MVGLTVSGLVLSFFNWRALFYVNILIGFIGTYWAHRRLKEMSKTEMKDKMDWAWFFLFATSVTSLLLALTFAAYGESDLSLVESLFVLCAASGISFVVWETLAKNPLFDLGLLRISEFTGGVLAQLLNGIS